jgi:hypothetical protein
VPYLQINADMVDARRFDEAAISRQLGDYIEMLERG